MFGIPILMLFYACGTSSLSPNLYGNWSSQKHKITVRTQPRPWLFAFISDSVITALSIHEDQTVEGTIGSAVIRNGTMKTNWLLPHPDDRNCL